jgi:hypothetical protein
MLIITVLYLANSWVVSSCGIYDNDGKCKDGIIIKVHMLVLYGQCMTFVGHSSVIDLHLLI